ncbi:hypothetical protein AJ79_02219 [Helicocarpus griseus UAMH5409]|uniref:Uncharacterized protein n=1 Tax=Helicocarpus griseus UAMH5409 TaxID=1447875 RepID=A0A2B7Y4R2_9EURO|nr:hypothetical protein AJ79_02219 [Helicocarpus griseus UAMH5409]
MLQLMIRKSVYHTEPQESNHSTCNIHGLDPGCPNRETSGLTITNQTKGHSLSEDNGQSGSSFDAVRYESLSCLAHRKEEQWYLVERQCEPRYQDINQSYMAVLSSDGDSLQNFEIVHDQASLVAALRRSFNLSSHFPVRWVCRGIVTLGPMY